MNRIPLLEQLPQRIDELRNHPQVAKDLTHELFLLGGRRRIHELLNGEVTEFLGRDRYERGDGECTGYRNGYKNRHLDTAEGRLDIALPQVRNATEPFE